MSFFSIIVPIYGVEEYLHACINSVLNQGFGDFELILVDDGSLDRCGQICDEYAQQEKRIQVLHKPNGGLVSARQAGIKLASGEYVLNLDGDDTIAPGTLREAYDVIRRTKADIVSFPYEYVYADNHREIAKEPVNPGLYDPCGITEKVAPSLILNENMEHILYFLAGKFVRRSLLTPNQLRVDPNICYGEDLCCILPCFLNAQSVYFGKRPAYRYTVREDSLSKSLNLRRFQDVQRVIETLHSGISIGLVDQSEQIARYTGHICMALLVTAAKGGKIDPALLKEISEFIRHSVLYDELRRMHFGHITIKSRMTMQLLQHGKIEQAYQFLYHCEQLKRAIKIKR